MRLSPAGSEAHLHSLSEAGAQERQEDSGDGHVVPGLGHPGVLSPGVHRHAAGDVPHRHLVTLWRGGGAQEKVQHQQQTTHIG